MSDCPDQPAPVAPRPLPRRVEGMARILIVGGHGKVALLTAPLLVAAGNLVHAVIRDPDQAEEVSATGATPLVADVESLDTDGLAALLASHDVVVRSAGAGGGSPERTYAVDRDAAIRTIDAAGLAGVPRFVMVSYFGAGPEHGVAEDDSFFAYADAKAAADAHLRDSDLDWVILGPSRLTDDPGTGAVSWTIADQDPEAKRQVARADVAAVIAQVVEHPEVSRITFEFNGGKVPVQDALNGHSSS